MRLVAGREWFPTPIGVSSLSATRNRVGVVGHNNPGFEHEHMPTASVGQHGLEDVRNGVTFQDARLFH